ncbi:hypothetical protein [Roseimarinus sediminis]|jgi:hypothetical protein|uniref:hypothetical protein n=1 Tax=Roseimarinus sediminis TaxID=1610899 RepID=UPI003D1DFEBC
MTKKIIFGSLLILLISIETYAQSKRVDRMCDEFIQSAFLSVNNQTFFIVKWENKDTLKYHIEGKMDFISEKSWNVFVNEVGMLVGMLIVETANPAEADIQLYFGELIDYFNKYNMSYKSELLLNDNFDYWSSRRYNKQNQLLFSSFCIVTSKTKTNDRGVYNIKRLFIKSLGLLGVVDSRRSLFNANSAEPPTGLYIQDKRLIKLFYSDAIKAGMNLDEVNKALETLDLEAHYKEKL